MTLMALELQVLDWDNHKNVAALYRFDGIQPSLDPQKQSKYKTYTVNYSPSCIKMSVLADIDGITVKPVLRCHLWLILMELQSNLY
jgi:hypothetical protein